MFTLLLSFSSFTEKRSRIGKKESFLIFVRRVYSEDFIAVSCGDTGSIKERPLSSSQGYKAFVVSSKCFFIFAAARKKGIGT